MKAFLFVTSCATLLIPSAVLAQETPWPPPLPGAKDGTVILKSDLFLKVPDVVEAARKDGLEFVVARQAPTVALAYHRELGDNAVNHRLWSSWGDICVARDGKVYCAIGDHGNDSGGDARCFIYVWDPARKTLTKIVDMNQVIPPVKGQPAWSKVHAKIDEGADGKIYFCCTLNDGNSANRPQFMWTEQLPGGQLYQYDPKTGKTVVFANLPPKRCTATSILDQQRQIWWCNLETGPNALWGLDLKTKKVVYEGPAGSVHFNRNFALARDGSLYFNGENSSIWKCEPTAGRVVQTKSAYTGSPGMRSSSAESKDGHIYGSTHGNGQLFRYTPAKDELKILGPTWWPKFDYVTVCELSPDERFLYYLPGAHGGAFRHGTPVVQYEIATGRKKLLAFLVQAFEQEHGFVPAGTYGMKVSTDGSTLYVNFNGHAADRVRPKHMKPIGFSLCAFAAIQIPETER